MKENRNYLFKNANIYVDKDGHSYAVDKDGNIIGTKGVSYQLPEVTIRPKVSTPWEAAQLTSKRNPNWRQTYDMSPNLETLNAVTAGVFNWELSPTTSARILWDAYQGNFDKVGKGIVYGNNGVFSDNYAAKHPWTSLGGNMVLDILSPLAWGKATKLATRAGKGIVDEFKRQAVLNRLSPVLGSGVPIRNTSDEITKILEQAFSDYLNGKDVGKLFKNADIKKHFEGDIKKFLNDKSNSFINENKEKEFNKLGEFENLLLGDTYTKYSTKEIKQAYDGVIGNLKNMTDEQAEILNSSEGKEYINKLKVKSKKLKQLKNELNKHESPKTASESDTPKTIDKVPVTDGTEKVAAPEPAKPVVPEPAKPVVPVTDGTGVPKPDTSTIAPVPESSPKPVTPETTVAFTDNVATTPSPTNTETVVDKVVKQADEMLNEDLVYDLPNGKSITIDKGTKIIKEGDELFVKDNFGNKIKITKKTYSNSEPDYKIAEGYQKGVSSQMANKLLGPEKHKYLTIKGNGDGTFTFGYKPVSKFYSLYTTSTKPGKASQLWNKVLKNSNEAKSQIYPEFNSKTDKLVFSEADIPTKGSLLVPAGRQFSIPRTLGSTLGLGYLFGGHKFINNYIQPTAKIAKNYYVGPSENGAASGWNQDITSLEGVPMDTFHVGKDIYGVPNVKFNIKDGEYIQESNGKYYQMYPLREMDNSFTPKGEAIYGTINSANKYQFPNETNKTKNASQSYTPTNVTKASSLPSVGEDTIQTTQQPQQQQPQQKTQQQKNQEIIDLMGFINKTNPLYKIINNYA